MVGAGFQMKRDPELVRKIVLMVEDHPHGRAPDIEIEGYSEERIGYHCYLIVDAGLAEGYDCSTMRSESPDWRIDRLTSAGHDFADVTRSDTVWLKVTTKIKEVGVKATIETIKLLAMKYAKQMLGLETPGSPE